ncbi:MAG: iron-containing alcohol dehydrogenase [Alphaproteobacteria bacterium]|nr:iron-containing alcohol dehydrogenase [Alphaproteobacteria bacterium]
MATITYLTKIQFDFGALGLLTDELAGLGATRPLIVTDAGLVATGLVDRVRDALPPGSDPPVFDGTPQNPTEAAVREGLSRYRKAGCDSIVGVGGGSSLDLAKGVRLLATHDGPLAQYALVEGGLARIRPDLPPLIAIPTTAGTGSEVGRSAVVIMDDGRKLGVVSPHMLPSVALCDPELTLALPPGLTAATGLDAIAHCIETFLSPAVNPPADAIALDGLHRAARHIETAVADGANRDARWNMMMAALEGAMAFQKGLGAVHAMSHPLGALPGLTLHHGTLNAVVMPAVLRFNAGHVGDKYDRLAEALGLAAGSDVADAIADLNRRLGIPTGLGEMGVRAEQLPPLAEQAMGDHCNPTNPRPATGDDYRVLFEACL